MSFDVEPAIQDVAVIRASGPLNMATASRFRELVTRIVGQDGRTRIVVDLAGLDQILHAYAAAEECFEPATSDASRTTP